MVKVLIVEDEFTAANSIKSALELHGYEVVGIASDARKGIALFNRHKPSIAIIDIELGTDLEGGIKVAQHISGSTIVSAIIFLTRHDDSRLSTLANETVPANYLMKPYVPMQLLKTIKLAESKIQRWKLGEMDPMLSNGKLYFQGKGIGKQALVLNSIICIRADDGHYAKIYVTDRKDPHLIVRTLRYLIERLPTSKFMRVHRSHIIDLDHVLSIDRSNRKIFLTDEITVPYSHSYKNTFLDWFDKRKI